MFKNEFLEVAFIDNPLLLSNSPDRADILWALGSSHIAHR
jgi:hypothetical protein